MIYQSFALIDHIEIITHVNQIQFPVPWILSLTQTLPDLSSLQKLFRHVCASLMQNIYPCNEVSGKKISKQFGKTKAHFIIFLRTRANGGK